MATVQYRPNPEKDLPEECLRAGWRFLDDLVPEEEMHEWTHDRKIQLLAKVALNGAQGQPTFIPEFRLNVASSYIASDNVHMILPLQSVIDHRVTVEPAP